MGIGWSEFLVIAIFALILFGTGRIPSIMEDVAKGIKAFKKGLKDVENDMNVDEDVKPVNSKTKKVLKKVAKKTKTKK